MRTAQIQGGLCGQRPCSWNELQEPAFATLYAAALEAARVGKGYESSYKVTAHTLSE
jgi:hypothetical protein